MGLTIHYVFTTSLTNEGEIHTLDETVRQLAQDLPFEEVSDLVEFHGQDADYQDSSPEDPYRWLKIQAGQYVREGSPPRRSRGRTDGRGSVVGG